MVESLLLMLGLISQDCTAHVAARASYVLHTRKVAVKAECCGLCRNGRVVHGDGHVTDCACPPDCKCKAVTHPPTVLRSECKDGKCLPRK